METAAKKYDVIVTGDVLEKVNAAVAANLAIAAQTGAYGGGKTQSGIDNILMNSFRDHALKRVTEEGISQLYATNGKDEEGNPVIKVLAAARVNPTTGKFEGAWGDGRPFGQQEWGSRVVAYCAGKLGGGKDKKPVASLDSLLGIAPVAPAEEEA